MEGSIADSTTLRIRKQLQCVTNANSLATKSDKVFFDEFLNFQFAKPSATKGQEEPSADNTSLPDPTETSSLKSRKAEERPESEEVDEHPHADDEASQTEAALAIVNPVLPPPVAPAEASSPELESEQLHTTLSTEQAASAVDEAKSESGNLPEKSAVAAATPTETSEPSIDSTAGSNSRATIAPIAGVTAESTKSPPPTETTSTETFDTTATTDGQPSQVTRPGEGSPVAANHSVGPSVKQQRHDDGVDSQANEVQAAAVDVQRRSAESADSGRVERSTRGASDDRREKWYESNEEDVSAEQSTADIEAKEKSADENEATSPMAPPLTAATPLESATSAAIDMPMDTALAAAPPSPAMLSEAAAQAAAAAGAGSGSHEAGGGSGGSRSGNSSSQTTGIGGASPLAPAGSRAEKSPGGEQSQGDVRELTQQERVRLVQRVAHSFSRLGPDGGQITLKLHPPQLGVLNVSVRIEGQTMSAKLQTESSAAREVILENLPVLRERLAEQGIDVSHFQVDVASAGDMDNGRQASNPFSGESRDGSANNHSSVDYRRLSRGSGVAEPAAAAAGWPRDGSWQARSLAEKTLDIRA